MWHNLKGNKFISPWILLFKLNYLDLLIIRTCFSRLSFSQILINHNLCPQQNFFSFKLIDETLLQTEFVSQQSTNLYAFHALTNTMHFTGLSLAPICSVADRHFTEAWFPCCCICCICCVCCVCCTKKIHRTDTTLWKPPVQMLNTTETTDTTCWTR